MSETKEIKLTTPEVEVNGDKITLTYDKHDFMNNAPDKDAVKKTLKYMREYTTAVTDDTVNRAPELFKKHESAAEVVSTAPFAGENVTTDVFKVRVEKERESINPQTKEKISKPRISTMVKSKIFPTKTALQKKRDALMEKL